MDIKIQKDSPCNAQETQSRLSRFLTKQAQKEELFLNSSASEEASSSRDTVDKTVIHQLELIRDSLQNLGDIEAAVRS